jgi:hypothetical protein
LNMPFSVVPLILLVNRYLKQAETNAGNRVHYAQNDFDIRWIASSDMLTIHNRFC